MKAGFVAVGGRPNVGKSTLFNSLLGSKVSIVSRRRQTTHYCIRGIITDTEAQIVLIDTPGWQTRHRSHLNRELNRSVERELPHADAGLLVVEAFALQPDDRVIVDFFPPQMAVVVAFNKFDLVKQREMSIPLAEEISSWRDFAAIVPVSALKGEGIDTLKQQLCAVLPESDLLYPSGQRLVQSEAVYLADFIRESIFHSLGDELPYSAAVELQQIDHRSEKLVRVLADIIVDRNSRKAMFIGAQGAMLKRIGTRARRCIEDFLNKRVYLELYVKVRRNWQQDQSQLHRMFVAGSQRPQ